MIDLTIIRNKITVFSNDGSSHLIHGALPVVINFFEGFGDNGDEDVEHDYVHDEQDHAEDDPDDDGGATEVVVIRSCVSSRQRKCVSVTLSPVLTLII